MIKKLKDIDFKDKRVLMRVDFNVPVDDSGKITDDTRIKGAIPTIKYVLDHGAKQLVLMSHLGDPEGKVEEKSKMNNVAKRLGEILWKKVVKVDDCIDITLPSDKIIMLENLRFHNEEKNNDEAFSKKLASYGDVYVNDAFGTCHRKHASMVGPPKFIPGCIGFLVEKEIENLSIDNPQRPFVAILGGAKISTKLGVVKNILPKVDKVILGGAMIFTLFKAQGINVGKSLVEDTMIESVKPLIGDPKVILPVDIVVANEISEKAQTKIVKVNEIPADWIGLDVGPESIKIYKEALKDAKTVFWNGPLGYFEIEKFAHSTKEIAHMLADMKGKAKTIIGGGDSAAAVAKMHLESKFTHVSTGGGASLEFIEGKKFPALEELDKQQ